MRKTILTFFVAIVAIFTLSAFVNSTAPSSGSVTFEAVKAPALDCTLPIQRVMDIYRLLPDNLAEACRNEYASVRQKSRSRSRFTHEGVDVRIKENGVALTIEFQVTGYKVCVNDVTWQELDNLFFNKNQE